jgi:hypothetical protein
MPYTFYQRIANLIIFLSFNPIDDNFNGFFYYRFLSSRYNSYSKQNLNLPLEDFNLINYCKLKINPLKNRNSIENKVGKTLFTSIFNMK